VHKCILVSKCQHCLRKITPLGCFAHPGHCISCRRWLGVSTPKHMDSESEVMELGVREAKNMAGLLEILPVIDPQTTRLSVVKNLSSYLQEVARGNLHAFAEYIGCRLFAIISRWLDGTRMPRFESLLSISGALSVSVARFFDPLGPTLQDIANARKSIPNLGVRNVYPFHRSNEIRSALPEAMDEPEPPRLLDVAHRLGYTTSQRLLFADRELSRKISERFRQSSGHYFRRKPGASKTCEAEVVKRALEEALQSSEVASSSARRICSRRAS
jgi:hypothetical protein